MKRIIYLGSDKWQAWQGRAIVFEGSFVEVYNFASFQWDWWPPHSGSKEIALLSRKTGV